MAKAEPARSSQRAAASPALRRVATVSLGTAAIATVLSLTLLAHASARRDRVNFPTPLDSAYLPPLPLLRGLALGHGEAVADLLWIDGLAHYGEQSLHGGDMSWLEPYFTAIVTLDPAFKQAYQWCGVAAMYNHDYITNQAVWRSTRCLELGARRFPDEWLFPFEIGANYLNELRTNDPRERARYRLLGASYTEEAALLPGSPTWLASIAAHVESDEGRRELAARSLERAIATTEDATERRSLERQLGQLHNATEARSLEEAAARFEAGWKASAPYLPADLFALIGPPPTESWDVRALGLDAVENADLDANRAEAGSAASSPSVAPLVPTSQ